PHCTALLCSVLPALILSIHYTTHHTPHTTTTRCDRPGPDCSSHAATKQAYHSRALLRGACSLHYTTIRHWILPTRPLRYSHRLPPSSTTLYLPSSGPSSAHCPLPTVRGPQATLDTVRTLRLPFSYLCSACRSGD
ncbi:hypothetical protein IWX46DRAFT_541730, partial [Phyllosticta citricarpa]